MAEIHRDIICLDVGHLKRGIGYLLRMSEFILTENCIVTNTINNFIDECKLSHVFVSKGRCSAGSVKAIVKLIITAPQPPIG